MVWEIVIFYEPIFHQAVEVARPLQKDPSFPPRGIDRCKI